MTWFWYPSQTGIRGTGSWNLEDKNNATEDYAAIKIGKYTIISVYLSPGVSIEVYAHKVKKLMEYVKKEKIAGNIIVGGDWNARSPVWGSDIQNQKGNIILLELMKVDLFPIKPHGGRTFERGFSRSNIDFLAATAGLMEKEEIETRILNKESASDHKYLLTTVKSQEKGSTQNNWKSLWKINKNNILNFQMTLAQAMIELDFPNGQNVFSEAETLTFMNLIREACDNSLIQNKRDGNPKKKNIWWNQELAESRRKLQKLKRSRKKRK